MKITGEIEVFKNAKGYLVGKLPIIVDGNKMADHYISVYSDELAKEFKGKREKSTLTIHVKEGYLNPTEIKTAEKSFTSLYISVKDFEIKKVFPEEKATKKSSK